MIVSLNGQIVKKEADSVVIECNGIGYFCSITSNTYDKLGDVGNNAYVKTYMQVSENNQALFGFIDNIEYDLFVLLISVSGIGPKTALNILSPSLHVNVVVPVAFLKYCDLILVTIYAKDGF